MNNPVQSAAKPADKEPDSGCAPQRAPGPVLDRNILVVDDDPQIRESLGKLLRSEGYGVELAADGRQAVEKFNTERIHLVLLDLNLPVNSGWDTFGTLTAIDPLIPIIIVTGRQKQSELAAAAGVSALMEKPLNVPLLLQTIADLLVEAPETRLKRLVGLQQDLRYVPPAGFRSPGVSSSRRPGNVIGTGREHSPRKAGPGAHASPETR